jgi:hypothetical protein
VAAVAAPKLLRWQIHSGTFIFWKSLNNWGRPNMSDTNVKLVSQGEPKLHEQKPSSYLLNVDVLNDLKHTIQEAKNSKSLAAGAGHTDLVRAATNGAGLTKMAIVEGVSLN